jgi:hypothetical protein
MPSVFYTGVVSTKTWNMDGSVTKHQVKSLRTRLKKIALYAKNIDYDINLVKAVPSDVVARETLNDDVLMIVQSKDYAKNVNTLYTLNLT